MQKQRRPGIERGVALLSPRERSSTPVGALLALVQRLPWRFDQGRRRGLGGGANGKLIIREQAPFGATVSVNGSMVD